MEIVIAWIIFAPLVGVLSSERGTGFWTGFLPSLAFSPVVGLIIVLVIRKPDAVRRAEIEKEERMRAEVRAQIEAEARGVSLPYNANAPLPRGGPEREAALRARLAAQMAGAEQPKASRGKPPRPPDWPE